MTMLNDNLYLRERDELLAHLVDDGTISAEAARRERCRQRGICSEPDCEQALLEVVRAVAHAGVGRDRLSGAWFVFVGDVDAETLREQARALLASTGEGAAAMARKVLCAI